MKRSIKRNGVESLMSCEEHNLLHRHLYLLLRLPSLLRGLPGHCALRRVEVVRVHEVRGTSLQGREDSYRAGRMEVRSLLVALLLTVGLLFIPTRGTASSPFSTETAVYFSPNRGTTQRCDRGCASGAGGVRPLRAVSASPICGSQPGPSLCQPWEFVDKL